jgi:hypothetical protein
MAEYIDRGALERALTIAAANGKDKDRRTWAKAICVLHDAPAADVAPVVRCKECEHAERYERTDGTVGYYCGHPQNTFTYGERWDRAFKPVKEADDFCSYGEPKMNGGDSDAAD